MFQKFAKGSAAPAPKSAGPLSIIGRDVRIVGDIITEGEMQIDGQVEGDITCASLLVGSGARISGTISAKKLKVHGEIHGTINADAVAVARSARIVGDITHVSLEIEAGAHLEGHLLRRDEARPAPLPFHQAESPVTLEAQPEPVPA